MMDYEKEYKAILETLIRERRVRQDAEVLIEVKSRELYEVNLKLKKYNSDLEKRVEERTVELQKALSVRDSFLKSIGHELYSPINVIQGYLKQFETKNENDLRILETLAKETSQLSSFIKILIKIAELESGKLNLNLSYVDIKEDISLIIDNYSTSQIENDISINIIDLNSNLLFELDKTFMDYLIGQIVNYISNYFKSIIAEIKTEYKDQELRIKFSIPTNSRIEINSNNDNLFLDPNNTNENTYLNVILGFAKKLLELFNSKLNVESFDKQLIIEFLINNVRTKPKKSDIRSNSSLDTKTKLVLIEKLNPIIDSRIFNDLVDFSSYLDNYKDELIINYKNQLNEYLNEFEIFKANDLLKELQDKLND